ncbi:MAG: aminotransferase class I/II-fold pyridoxal phosphate-dependent enzyme [Ferruginibacter sp.]|nr:aminotransferase class I/II-fold pyridoxal phosphate-dependent enzyme [Ferruginibacter sp.]
MKLSVLAQTLIGSEIVKLGGIIKDKISKGEHIYNYTIGDFDSTQFPIPTALLHEIKTAYDNGFTTYPIADGEADLRKAVSDFIKNNEGLEYAPTEILIGAGGRPLIYAVYRAIVDKGDKVIYPVPSWNNNHYTHFTEGEHILIEASKENNFMPTAAQIKPHVKGAALIALCSPLNPTGTVFTKEDLEAICDLVLEENAQRAEGEKKLYLMYDQMYWTLTFGDTVHHNPVTLRPAMKDYTIFIDGISKAFAATGVRVGWSLGPTEIIAKMKAINSHVGAWAPMAEQKAVAKFLQQEDVVNEYLVSFKKEVEYRLTKIYNGFITLKNEGFLVDAIVPQAAIYLTVQINLVGKKINEKILNTQADVTAYILDEAKLAIVPFNCFGAKNDSTWYRISVGCVKKEEINEMLSKLKIALQKLED